MISLMLLRSRSSTRSRIIRPLRNSAMISVGGQLFPRPLVGGCSGCPCFCDAAAFLAEGVGVVVELCLESELLAWVYTGVVELCAPGRQGAERPGVLLVGPPLVFE